MTIGTSWTHQAVPACLHACLGDQVLKKICWYAVLAPSYSTAEGSSSDVSTLIATTAAYKQLGDLSLHQQLLTTFTNPEIIRWGLLEAQYGPEIAVEVRGSWFFHIAWLPWPSQVFPTCLHHQVHLHASMLCTWISWCCQAAQIVHTAPQRMQCFNQCVALQQRYKAAPWHGCFKGKS